MPSTDDEIRVDDAASPSTPSKERVSRPEFATPTSGRDSEPRSSVSIPPSAKALEERIIITGRGRIVTDVPRDEFQKSFLSRLKQDVHPSPRHAAYFQVTQSQEWGEQRFYQDVLKSSIETMCAASTPLFISSLLPVLTYNRIWNLIFNSIIIRRGPLPGLRMPGPTF